LDAGADVCDTSTTPEESWPVTPSASVISTSADMLLAFAATLWQRRRRGELLSKVQLLVVLSLVKLTLPHSRYDGRLLGR